MRSLIIGAVAIMTTIATASIAPAQDARRGEHVFRKCLLCHVLDPKATNLIAPPLHNVIGRRAADIPGFAYSEIMKLAREKGLIWNADSLYYFLDRPEEFMPGTYMAFAGLDERERRDVIAYLTQLTESHNAQPDPRPAPTVPFSAPRALVPVKPEAKGAGQPAAAPQQTGSTQQSGSAQQSGSTKGKPPSSQQDSYPRN